MAATSFQDSIILFGDSITQSWESGSFAHRMAETYNRKLDVLNRGFGGYTTEWCLPIFEEMFRNSATVEGAGKVRLVTIWFGANDACLPPSPQCLPLEKYIKNTEFYVDSILTPGQPFYQPEAAVLLIPPGPICQVQREAQKLQYPPDQRWKDRTLENTQRYKDAILDIAKRKAQQYGSKRVAVADIWKIIMDAADGGVDEKLQPFFTDGLHMTPAGYNLVYNEVMRVIKGSFWGLDPENQETLPMRWPSFAVLDYNDAVKSIKDEARRPPVRPRDEL